jgi:hypothetical protein
MLYSTIVTTFGEARFSRPKGYLDRLEGHDTDLSFLMCKGSRKAFVETGRRLGAGSASHG